MSAMGNKSNLVDLSSYARAIVSNEPSISSLDAADFTMREDEPSFFDENVNDDTSP